MSQFIIWLFFYKLFDLFGKKNKVNIYKNRFIDTNKNNLMKQQTLEQAFNNSNKKTNYNKKSKQ